MTAQSRAAHVARRSGTPEAPVRIGVALDLREHLSRRVLAALGATAAVRPGWRILLEGYELNRVAELATCDVLVVRAHAHPVLRSAPVRRRTVALTGHQRSDVHRVWCDDAAIGRLAAGHLLERGYRHLAFRDDRRIPSLGPRLAAFANAVRAAGATFHRIPHPRLAGRAWTLEREGLHLRREVARLPRPLGLAAYDASTARRFTADLLALGLRVPEDVGVVACTDEPLLTGIGSPGLTAVDIAEDRLGLAVVAAVENVLMGRDAAPVLVPPVGIVTRASTASGAGDPLARALALLGQRPDAAGDLDALAAAVGMSRRSLERRWREVLGQSPGASRTRQRIDLACRLLADPGIPVADVAARCGFASRGSFSHVFRRVLGIPPAAWRRRRT